MAKLVVGSNIVVPATLFTLTFDHAEFIPNCVMTYEEATDERYYVSTNYTDLHKVTISPGGVAYPGDATPGTGAKTVAMAFYGAAPVLFTLVDGADFDVAGWVILQVGNHLIGYNHKVVKDVYVIPS